MIRLFEGNSLATPNDLAQESRNSLQVSCPRSLPRTRSEDGVFRESLGKGQIQWQHIHDKRNDDGKIVDKYSIPEQASLSVEGYRLVWYHSTRKAEQDSHARHQQVERALTELSELRLKLSSPRTRF